MPARTTRGSRDAVTQHPDLKSLGVLRVLAVNRLPPRIKKRLTLFDGVSRGLWCPIRDPLKSGWDRYARATKGFKAHRDSSSRRPQSVLRRTVEQRVCLTSRLREKFLQSPIGIQGLVEPARKHVRKVASDTTTTVNLAQAPRDNPFHRRSPSRYPRHT